MMNKRWLVAGAALAAALATVFDVQAASDADVLRCRAITDTAARLACYDAIPASASPHATVPAGAAPASTVAATAPAVPGNPATPVSRAASTPSTAPATSAAPSAAAPTVPPASTAATAPADAESEFGLQRKSSRSTPDMIESYIPGQFEGWGPGSRIRLANGQVWRIVDDSHASYWLDNPRVKVHRGWFGNYILEIAGAGHAPRVQRMQ